MNKLEINKIQTRIMQLLPAGKRNRPGILLADSCSEIARLVAGWLKKLDSSDRIVILKGVNVGGTSKKHDILAVETTDKKVYVIDPTVWQFFPQEESILVFIGENREIVMGQIMNKYGGRWSESEEFVRFNRDKEKKYLDIIFQNIRENLK